MEDMRKKILIVDDDESFVKTLATHLTEMNFEVLNVDNSHEARDIIEKGEIVGLVLDMQLKESLGTELIPDLLNTDFHTVVASGYVTPIIERQLKERQILCYNKNSSSFNPKTIAKSFALLGAPLNSNVEPKTLMPKLLPDGDALRLIIYQRLKLYSLNPKRIGYKRIVEGIYHTLKPTPEKGETLASVFGEPKGIEYRAAFSSIRDVLIEASNNHPEIFCEFYHQKEKKLLTPTNFVHHIVEEIKNEFSES